jgi:hypothetical protein
MASTNKIPLPSFLKLLTSNNIPTPKAMAVAGKMSQSLCVLEIIFSDSTLHCRYKNFNTPAMLSQLTDVKMKAAGIDDKDLRKSVLAAFRKAGYKALADKATNKTSALDTETSSNADGTEPGPSTVQILVSIPRTVVFMFSVPCE